MNNDFSTDGQRCFEGLFYNHAYVKQISALVALVIAFANILKIKEIHQIMNNKNIKLAKDIKVKPRIADVVNAMQPGDSVLFEAIDFGPLQTARAAVSRANKRTKTSDYNVVTEDNGVSYIISRN